MKNITLCIISALFVFFLSHGCKDKAAKSTDKTSNPYVIDSSSPVPLSMPNPSGEDNLRLAAMEGNLNSVENLLTHKINVNAIDPDGRTALMLASFEGHTETVRVLLDNGALVNLTDFAGRTALMYASTGPNVKTVELLLSKNADPNIADIEEKFTALMFAAAEGQMEVVKVLLANKADPRLKDKDNDDAESFARTNRHIEVANLIKSYVK